MSTTHCTPRRVAGVFFPSAPESLVSDLVQQAVTALRPGLRIYTNGQQLGLFERAPKGWALFATRTAAAALPAFSPVLRS